jgi:fatty acid desaturase
MGAPGGPHIVPIVQRARYAAHIAVHILLFAAGLYWLAHSSSLAIRMGIALLLALAVVQLGLLAHDAAHRQILRGRRAAEALGFLLWNLACGISLAWWRDKHLRHHRHPNVPGRDPDLYFFAFTAEDAARRRGVVGFVSRHQAAALLGLVTCTAAYFQVLSILFLLKHRPRRWRLELTAIFARHALFFGTVAALLGLPVGVAFVALHYAAVGAYLGLVFMTNHYGLPVCAAAPGADAEHSFAVTRNVRTGPIGDYLFGGLNYQIEHHLQPQLPRYALPLAAARLRAARRARDLPYHESTWGEALVAVLRDFHGLGAGLRKARDAA